MLTYVEGDLFTSPADVLVNTVNTIGVMGKGIAKEFKEIYPEMFRDYQRLCESKELTIGKLFLYKTPNKWILNFPTKRHWRQKSRLADIEAGLKTFVAIYPEKRISSIAFPQLGCGNGELDWEGQVRPLMERYLGDLPIDIFIHIYTHGSLLPEHRDRQQMKAWLHSEPETLAFSEVWDDLLYLTGGSPDHGWYVLRDENDEAVAIKASGPKREETLPKEDLFDLWQRLRTFGFLAKDDLPKVYEPIGDQLFDVLESLPYVESARFITRTNGALSPKSTQDLLRAGTSEGIRLVPSLQKTPPIHLAGTGVE